MWKEVKKQLIIKEFKNICFLNFLEKKERKKYRFLQVKSLCSIQKLETKWKLQDSWK